MSVYNSFATTMPPVFPGPEALARYLSTFDFFEKYAYGQAEGSAYVRDHVRRFHDTLALLPNTDPGLRVLELGAVPYYMTILVEKHLGARVDPLSFYEVEEDPQTTYVVESAEFGERYEFSYRAVNVERDPFPFASGTHDLVLCCEILEHLLINPSHMLHEIHHMLKPDGYLVLSTPNVLRWSNLVALAEGRNVYDHYHGNGIYGRHNREYTPREVALLLNACGFAVEQLLVRDVYDHAQEAGSCQTADAWGRAVRPEDRGDTIFAVARASGEARMAFPDELFLLMNEYRCVVRSDVRLAVDDGGHLGRGWHGPEFAEGRGCRWTHGRAELLLRHRAAGTLCIALCAHHPDLATHPIEVGVQVNGRDIGGATLGAVRMAESVAYAAERTHRRGHALRGDGLADLDAERGGSRG